MPKRRREDASNDVEASRASVKKFHAYICEWRDAVSAPDTVKLPSQHAPCLPKPQTLLSLVTTAPAFAEASAAPTLSVASSPFATDTCSGTGIIYDAHMMAHASTDPKDYERPARLERSIDHLQAVGLMEMCERLPARSAKTRELRRVHSRDHIDYVDNLEFFMSLKDTKSASVGQDLYASSDTSKAARHAAGCAVEAALAVATGKLRNAFALVRPPGHHAAATAASGFCFFNNVAVAARAVQDVLMRSTTAGSAKPRILILDWDVHHCDGTESIFHDDDSVLVVSLHQYRKGHGHVLRKTPSVLTSHPTAETGVEASANATDEVDLDTLAGLLDADVDATRTTRPVDDAPVVQPESTRVAEIPAAPPVVALGRRERKVVDYNALAEELKVDDAAAAALFHTRLSNSSSSTTSSSSSSSSHGGREDGGLPPHIAGDTEGRSVDQFTVDGDHEEKNDDDLFYPGTGHLETVGGNAEENSEARGKNMNIAWPTYGMGDIEYLHVLSELVLPVAQEFGPEMVLISAGFDSCQGDLLGSMNVSPSGFYLMTKAILAQFPRTVAVLEGGYNVSNVARCSEAVLRALLETSRSAREANTKLLPPSRMLLCQAERLVQRVKALHRPYWTCFQDGAPKTDGAH